MWRARGALVTALALQGFDWGLGACEHYWTTLTHLVLREMTCQLLCLTIFHATINVGSNEIGLRDPNPLSYTCFYSWDLYWGIYLICQIPRGNFRECFGIMKSSITQMERNPLPSAACPYLQKTPQFPDVGDVYPHKYYSAQTAPISGTYIPGIRDKYSSELHLWVPKANSFSGLKKMRQHETIVFDRLEPLKVLSMKMPVVCILWCYQNFKISHLPRHLTF